MHFVRLHRAAGLLFSLRMTNETHPWAGPDFHSPRRGVPGDGVALMTKLPPDERKRLMTHLRNIAEHSSVSQEMLKHHHYSVVDRLLSDIAYDLQKAQELVNLTKGEED